MAEINLTPVSVRAEETYGVSHWQDEEIFHKAVMNDVSRSEPISINCMNNSEGRVAARRGGGAGEERLVPGGRNRGPAERLTGSRGDAEQIVINAGARWVGKLRTRGSVGRGAQWVRHWVRQ